MAKWSRLDEALVGRGIVADLELARRLVMAGRVRVDDQRAVSPDRQVSPHSAIELEEIEPYVSRGGRKLEAALERFPIPVAGRVCADVGSSTGGFTDCLLQRGASRIYAIDSGTGQLHYRLRGDRRVTVMERTNARELGKLPEQVDLAVVDVSFISLSLLIPVIRVWMKERGHLVALVKPQFEAEPDEVEHGGVVREPAVRGRVVASAIGWCQASGLAVQGALESPLRGPKGNREYLLWAAVGMPTVRSEEVLGHLFGPNAQE